jgi:hypothetical protein
MACIPDQCALFGEGFEGVAGDEPGCFDVVFLEKVEEADGANMAREETYCAVIILKKRIRVVCAPRLISLALSSPPYEPNQPATASISTP